MSEHPLRDFARQIRELAQAHPAYSQASPVVLNCVDHLSAIAGSHEANARLEEARRLHKKSTP